MRNPQSFATLIQTVKFGLYRDTSSNWYLSFATLLKEFAKRDDMIAKRAVHRQEKESIKSKKSDKAVTIMTSYSLDNPENALFYGNLPGLFGF